MKSEIVICGAGIAGIAAAYYLSVKKKQSQVVLIDKRMPMSLTTSKSGENYRDYWPQPMMTEFVSHSLDLMDEIAQQPDNFGFEMRQIGYDFVSQQQADIFASSYSQGEHNRYYSRSVERDEISRHRPYLADSVNQIVSVHRAGEMDVYALGSYMLREARRAGVTLKQACITGISQRKAGDFTLEFDQGVDALDCEKLVIAAGPFSNTLAAMLGVELPLQNFLQRKFVIPDPIRVIPREMPFTIFADKQYLKWSATERALIASQPEFSHLLEEFPAGLHIKPEGQDNIKMGWAYNRQAELPVWEQQDSVDFVDIVIRGASRIIPALAQYIDKVPTPMIQYSGYYTRTPENLPLIGETDLDNVYLVGGLSGFGTMAACAAGDLIADTMNGASVPGYAKYFDPRREKNAQIMREINAFVSDGQL